MSDLAKAFPSEPSASYRAAAVDVDGSADVPDQLSARRLRRRLLALAAAAAAITAVVLAAPGLGELRGRLAHASPGWLLAGIGLEVLSALSYVVIFKSVFCSRMSWRVSSEIGMSELAANSVLPVSGASGLALGAWALRRRGMNAERIARKTVAFFFLASLANVGSVIVLATLYATGLLGDDPNARLTYVAGGLALIAVVVVLALPLGIARKAAPEAVRDDAGALAKALGLARRSLADGVLDAVLLLRQRSPGALAGSFGTMGFDLAVLGVSFHAFGASPPVGVLALGYLIGQLGGNLPVPGGIGGVDAGLIGTFGLYHQPLAAATLAVLAYHTISLWVPGLLGGVAFVRLRRTLQREDQFAALRLAPAGIETPRAPAGVFGASVADSSIRAMAAHPGSREAQVQHAGSLTGA